MKYLIALTVLTTCVCAVRCQNNYYIERLTHGLRPPTPVPEELQEIVTQLTSLEFSDVVPMFQSSDLLRNGVKGRLVQSSLGADPTPSPDIPTPSQLCVNQTAQALVGLMTGQQWALQMLDSAGKPGSGLLQFQVVWLGNYEECVGVKATQTQKNVTSQLFKGRYCKASIPFGPPTAAIGMPGMTAGVGVGLCFPDSCSGEDVTLILNSLLETVLNALNTTTPFKFGQTLCQDEELEWDTKAIAVFVVAMIFVALLVVGTIYDIVFIQYPKWYILSAESESLLNGSVETNTSLNIKRHLDESAPLLDPEKKVDIRQSEPNICGKILLSFSVYTNGSKLLSTRQSAGSLTAVNGIRFLSMSWVILGHGYVFGLGSVDNLATYFPEVLKRFTFQGISNATVSVDSFFVLSGLLVAYLALKEMRRSGGKINWFMFYFHRFWRLTPPYMLLMMVYVPLFPYLNTGPLWPQAGVEINQCQNSWWTNLLYVNNLVRVKEMCMGWSWYLANDMQFYILSPLIFVPLFFSGVFGTISVLVFLLATMTTAGVLSRVHNMQPGLAAAPPAGSNATTGDPNDQMAYFFDYYITPYCRMGPYIIGMVTGYILYRTDCKIRLNKWIVIGGWCVATASALAVLYGLYGVAQGHPITADVAAFYNAVHRTVWGACLCWVIFACATGYGGYVNTLLSWPAFIPLGRLTYCAYLVHPIVMYFVFLSRRTLIHLTDVTMVYYFFSHMVAAYLAAFIVSMAFEAPMMGLEKALLKREKSS